MTKLKQFVFAVMIFGLGIVMVNNFLFSLGELSCACYYLDSAETECNNKCADNGGCMSLYRIRGWCEIPTASCVTYFRLICEDGTYYTYEHMEYCPKCAFE